MSNKLTDIMTEKFRKSFDEMRDKEEKVADFLNQKDFLSCEARATKALLIVIEPLIKDLGYAIAVNREKDHSDDTMEEQARLLEQGADPEMGVMGFWN